MAQTQDQVFLIPLFNIHFNWEVFAHSFELTTPRVSPVDDVTTFQEVLVREAQKLNIAMVTPQTSSLVIFETLHQRSSSRPLLPLVPGLLEPVTELFLTPASVKPAPSRLQRK